ncbi:MAG TPA: Ig-like domain-containing protein [Thermoanaerobaculia bacterium]|nr:Ig-like domain-containing protein [Thermoanaerobaculia bacterium]
MIAQRNLENLSRALRVACALVAGAALFAGSPAGAQLDDHCSVTALNRTAPVAADGTWSLPNVPANQGLVRIRVTCVEGDDVRSGESSLITVPPNGKVRVPPLDFGGATPIPVRLDLSSPTATLTAVDASTQLAATAFYADGSNAGVTPGGTGTSYRSSNPEIASVAEDGLVTAHASGRVLLSAVHEGALGIFDLRVVVSGDSDGDGIADDLELANGLDPNDPIDALLDLDDDGLTNGRELAELGTDIRRADTDGDGLDDGEEIVAGADGFVTDPLRADTDGDGIRDGLEVTTGTDPTDPASFDLAATLTALEIRPGRFTIVSNSLLGDASRRLAVIGLLRDGAEIDLTSRGRGTSYSSSDFSVCNFGLQDGQVFAGQGGQCTITATNAGHVATAAGLVDRFFPTPLTHLNLPGDVSGVRVEGDLAYIASQGAGLMIVDVANRRDPQLLTTLGLPGPGAKIELLHGENTGVAAIAAGPGGLVTVDVSDPLHPAVLANAFTGGVARDVALFGNLAAVVGSSGLDLFDLSNPADPVHLGTLAEVGDRSGVDLSEDGRLAIVVGFGNGGGGGGTDLARVGQAGTSGFDLVDLSDPANPVARGSLALSGAVDATLRNGIAFVATIDESLTTADVTDPDAPLRLASTPPAFGGRLNEVALFGDFAFGADIFFVNGIPIIDVADPAAPLTRDIIDFSEFADDNAISIDADARYAYMGGFSGLFIGQYLQIQDNAGIAPTISILSPASGGTVIEDSSVDVTVDARDDFGVAAVEFLINGDSAGLFSLPPYSGQVQIPFGVSTATITARAFDFGGNTADSLPVTLSVIPDPLTTAVGQVSDGAPVAGAQVELDAGSTVTDGDGNFSVPDLPTTAGDLRAAASAFVGGTFKFGLSATVPPVPAGVTDLGTIQLEEGGCTRAHLVWNGGGCGIGPVTETLELYRIDPVVPESSGGRPRVVIGQDEFVGEVDPDFDGGICALLRRGFTYSVRRRKDCDGRVFSCSAEIMMNDPNAGGLCSADPGTCQDLGTIDFLCFTSGS